MRDLYSQIFHNDNSFVSINRTIEYISGVKQLIKR